jgi:hypothetical protein
MEAHFDINAVNEAQPPVIGAPVSIYDGIPDRVAREIHRRYEHKFQELERNPNTSAQMSARIQMLNLLGQGDVYHPDNREIEVRRLTVAFNNEVNEARRIAEERAYRKLPKFGVINPDKTLELGFEIVSDSD